MLKINKNMLCNLNVVDVKNLEGCEWVESSGCFFEGEGVYLSNNGSRGENEIVKVELDSEGNFEVDSVESMLEMGEDEEFVESGYGELVSVDSKGNIILKVVYNISYGEECWGNYFYYSGGV